MVSVLDRSLTLTKRIEGLGTRMNSSKKNRILRQNVKQCKRFCSIKVSEGIMHDYVGWIISPTTSFIEYFKLTSEHFHGYKDLAGQSS